MSIIGFGIFTDDYVCTLLLMIIFVRILKLVYFHDSQTFASSAHRGGHCGRGHGHSGHDHSGDGPDSGDHGLSLDGYGCTRVGRRFGHWRHSRDGRRSRRSYGYNERRGWGHHAT